MPIVTIHAIAIDPAVPRLVAAKAFLKLLKGIERWKEARGADHILLHNTAGVRAKATERIMRRWGAEPIGGNWLK